VAAVTPRGSRAAPALLALIAVGGLAAPADAKLRRFEFRYGPLHIAPYQVGYTGSGPALRVRAPRVDGYIVRMNATVVDKRGRRLPVRRVMLHHVLFKNLGRFDGDRREAMCGHKGESFYGTGEESQPLRLPRGYGYRIRRRDRWRIAWMLMNHRNRPETAYIRYRIVVETRRRLRPVTPYWVRVTGCRYATDPIFNIPGGGPRGSAATRSGTFALPRSGRLVAANAHLHGGAEDLVISQPSCGDRVLMRSRPFYGLPSHPYYHVLPVLHEPGPIATSWAATRTGIPIRGGDRLRLTSLYDGELPHTRVMAIMHLYVDHSRPAAPEPCPPLPSDMVNRLPHVPGRHQPPRERVPLTGIGRSGRARTISRPPGRVRVYGGDASVRIRAGAFSVRNLSIPIGASVSWRSYDPIWHNATLANGPEGFGSPMLERGRAYRQTFTRPGLYRVFCTLHPIAMTQAIEVRPGGSVTRR
jgi:plastocyanin